MRKVVAAAVLAAGIAALLRRRPRAEPRRVELYFDDGSMISLVDGSPQADELLALADDVLRGRERR